VARTLCRHGANLSLVARDKANARRIFSSLEVTGEIIEADLGNHSEVLRLLHDIRPSIIFNLAGYGVDSSERDEEVAFQINVRLVESICQAMATIKDQDWRGQQIIHTGSALEYGATSSNLSEDSSPCPTTLYGKSKLAGTRALARLCGAHEISGITARLFTVYGPGEHPGRLLPSLIETARTGDALPLTAGDQRRDFTYVEDVADMLLRLGLASASAGEVVNLATGRLTSVRDFAETAARALGIPAERLKFGVLPMRGEEMKHSQVTTEKLRRMTGPFSFTSIEEGIRKTKDLENRPEKRNIASVEHF
jgi:nucleoside-diphosphate-sugar epimerase